MGIRSGSWKLSQKWLKEYRYLEQGDHIASLIRVLFNLNIGKDAVNMYVFLSQHEQWNRFWGTESASTWSKNAKYNIK